MDKDKIINDIATQMQEQMDGASSGIDWWHTVRVWNLAKHIGEQEGANMFVVELAALVQDIADWKFHEGDEAVGPKMTRAILTKHGVDENIISEIAEIVSTISFKGAGVETPMKTLEGKVVQDANRLDAIGAIGVG